MRSTDARSDSLVSCVVSAAWLNLCSHLTNIWPFYNQHDRAQSASLYYGNAHFAVFIERYFGCAACKALILLLHLSVRNEPNMVRKIFVSCSVTKIKVRSLRITELLKTAFTCIKIPNQSWTQGLMGPGKAWNVDKFSSTHGKCK